jgi:hypothetical protein
VKQDWPDLGDMRMVPSEFPSRNIEVNEVFHGVEKTWRQVHIDIPVLDHSARGLISNLVQVNDDHHHLIELDG